MDFDATAASADPSSQVCDQAYLGVSARFFVTELFIRRTFPRGSITSLFKRFESPLWSRPPCLRRPGARRTSDMS